MKTKCPGCQKRLTVTDAQLGRKVKCPRCKTPFTAAVDPDPPADGLVRFPCPGCKRRVKLKPQQLMMLSLALEALAVIREAEDVEDPLQRHADEPAELIRGVLIGVPPPASL